jgi:hypothetical protein
MHRIGISRLLARILARLRRWATALDTLAV